MRERNELVQWTWGVCRSNQGGQDVLRMRVQRVDGHLRMEARLGLEDDPGARLRRRRDAPVLVCVAFDLADLLCDRLQLIAPLLQRQRELCSKRTAYAPCTHLARTASRRRSSSLGGQRAAWHGRHMNAYFLDINPDAS